MAKKEDHYYEVERIEYYNDIFCGGDCLQCAGDGICVGDCVVCGTVLDKHAIDVRVINYEAFCSDECMKIHLPDYNENPRNLAEFLASLHKCLGCGELVEGEYICTACSIHAAFPMPY